MGACCSATSCGNSGGGQDCVLARFLFPANWRDSDIVSDRTLRGYVNRRWRQRSKC
ncbi:hypothetical protein BJX76DRAFT_321356 [Aspergillus varians]